MQTNDTDRTIRQIFGNSDDENDLDLDYGEEDLEDNLPLAVLRPRSEDSEDEMEFELSSDEEDKEVEETEEWSSNILTHEDFNLTVNLLGLR